MAHLAAPKAQPCRLSASIARRKLPDFHLRFHAFQLSVRPFLAFISISTVYPDFSEKFN
jgi:hypothetical protein